MSLSTLFASKVRAPEVQISHGTRRCSEGAAKVASLAVAEEPLCLERYEIVGFDRIFGADSEREKQQREGECFSSRPKL